jgi:glycosyltransferase involved in cell wall biosynthesis
VFLDYYLPGYKSGGPLRTIANLVERLGRQFDFWILTRDRDATDLAAYPRIKVNNWNKLGQAMVYYASPDSLSLANIRRLIRQVSPDVVYLNSFFSALMIKFLVLRWLGAWPVMPVILAPRGEFSPGALQLKAAKKKFFLALALRVGLYRGLIWQASSALEERDIRQVVGHDSVVHIALNISSRIVSGEEPQFQKPAKLPGQINLIFLSRVSPKKNLRQVLQIIQRLSGQITLDIYGPIRDECYWQQCKDMIARMSTNVRVTYQGSVPHAEAVSTLARYDFFILPTLGENFGHAILEALLAGCPVLVSDQTPWLNLVNKQIGWDLPLDDLELWRKVLQDCIEMDEISYTHMSQSARRFAMGHISSPEAEHQSIAMFNRALGQHNHYAR